MKNYNKPIQPRAIETEKKFKESARKLFEERGSLVTTIDEIAEQALLHRGAFLKRFGSKDGVKTALYRDYFEDVERRMKCYRAMLYAARFRTLEEAFFFASTSVEEVQLLHLSVTRIMYEDFSIEFAEKKTARSHFCRAVRLVSETDSYFSPNGKKDKASVRAAAQLIVTLNFEYVVAALDGFPRNKVLRHQMISSLAGFLLK